MNKKTCIPKRYESDWKFWVHIQDKTQIDTEKKLLEICNNCDDFLCKTAYDLIVLLKANNIK